MGVVSTPPLGRLSWRWWWGFVVDGVGRLSTAVHTREVLRCVDGRGCLFAVNASAETHSLLDFNPRTWSCRVDCRGSLVCCAVGCQESLGYTLMVDLYC